MDNVTNEGRMEDELNISDFPMFFAKNNYVVCVVWINGIKVALKYDSPKEIIDFTAQLLNKAIEVWPDDELVKRYLSNG